MEKLHVLVTPEAINALGEKLTDANYVAFDVETTGTHKGAEIIGVSLAFSEDEAYYIILAKWDVSSNQLIYLDNKRALHELLLKLQTKSLIMHNGVFDCAMVENNFKITLIDSLHTDTMILAHLLDENRWVGLKELGKQYFGERAAEEQKVMKESIIKNGGQVSKASYELYKADAELIARYGAKDALLTLKLFYILVTELYEQGLEKFFYEEESMPLLKGPTYELNTTGLKVDMAGLKALKQTLETECLEAREYIYSEIREKIKEKYPGTSKKNTFNIGSNQQLAWLLFGQYGLEFNTLTKSGKKVAKEVMGRLPYSPVAKRNFIAEISGKAGKPLTLDSVVNGKLKRGEKIREPWAYIQADREALNKHAGRYKFIQTLLEYQKKQKILHTYVEGIEERTKYGVIYPSFLQHGTTSGRYSSRDPNFQNLPRDDKRVKACIVARPGKTLVGADYSQLEPRVFAYFSGDARLQEAFRGTEDFYSVIGIEVYGKYDATPYKEGSPEAFGVKYKKLRDLSKVIALASTYGASAFRLSRTTGKNVEDTQKDIDSYFERFPGVAEMMKESHRMAKATGQVTNLFGRPRRMPEATKIDAIYGNQELPYEARNLLNLAVNHRVQSTAASIVNRAAIAFYKACKEENIGAKLVVQVHDSLVVECEEAKADRVSILLRKAMEDTVILPGVRLEALPKIGISLADV